jgi:hypothetical protein
VYVGARSAGVLNAQIIALHSLDVIKRAMFPQCNIQTVEGDVSFVPRFVKQRAVLAADPKLSGQV